MGDISGISDLVRQLRQFADHLDDRATSTTCARRSDSCSAVLHDQDTDFGRIADRILMNRRLRDQAFGGLGLFGEPAWDILLEIISAESRNKRTSIKNASIASCAPPTTALRYLSVIESHGLIERFDDPADRRRTFVGLTTLGRQMLRNALRNELASPAPPPSLKLCA